MIPPEGLAFQQQFAKIAFVYLVFHARTISHSFCFRLTSMFPIPVISALISDGFNLS